LTRNHNKESFGQNWSVLLEEQINTESGDGEEWSGDKAEKKTATDRQHKYAAH